MNTKLSILFFVKRTKTNTDGLLPIFIRITINGKRIEFSTKRITTSEKWSVEGNRMKGTSAEAKATNSYLDALKAKVYNYQQELIREDELVNAENMRNKI
ncbi:MAG: Arm DNA-binding domain-containing protein, partial [Paludibacter sp.]|nr:Arm DNA-binding domain-containing protein [Paludibacter sp.]